MPIFQYRARNQDGKIVTGELESESKDAVGAELINRGDVPVSIEPVSALTQTWRAFVRRGSVPVDEMVLFCRQMYALLKAGVSITASLVRLSETTDNKTLKRVLLDVAEGISAGKTLANAMGEYPNTFPPVMLSVIDAGENSGRLDLGFLQLSKYLELESQTRKRIKAALRYPTIVIITVLGALMVINFMVVPAFSSLFASFGAELPLPTRILISVSNFLLNYWLWLLLVALGGYLSWRYYVATEAGKILKGYLALRLPIVGKILHRIILARFARTFTMILRAGVPIIKGIELAANSIGNLYMQQEFLKMQADIAAGVSLSKAAAKTKLFSSLVLQMLTVGEETGQIDDMLENVAEFYERETEYDLSRLSSMIEPIVLGILGIMVLILALGVFLPMWSMASLAGG
jgi:MSHA biogenesis protein MshG